MAEQTIFDRPERLPAAFDGTELMEVAPTSAGISYKSPVGTAASRNVTTSATDTTDGRLLQKGYHGIGATAASGTGALDVLDLQSGKEGRGSGTGIFSARTVTEGVPSGIAPVGYDPILRMGASAEGNRGADLYFHTNALRAFLRTRGFDSNWRNWQELYHTGNTTVDSNGFIKEASPIIRLFGTGEIEEPCQPTNAKVTRKSTGHYEITGTLGFAQKGWYIETPKDANGSIKVLTEYSQDKKGKITVKTYEPTGQGWRPEKGDPIDIPDGRWIDIRLEAPEPEETDVE